jgi:hypothetical protein
MSVTAGGRNGDLHVLLKCLNGVRTGPSRVDGSMKRSLALVDEANAPWNHIPRFWQEPPTAALQTCEYDLDRGSFEVKKSWWDTTHLDVTQRMDRICYEITLFDMKAAGGLRSFIMHDIDITEADVLMLLTVLEDQSLEVLVLVNVNLDDKSADLFARIMRQRCNGPWENLTRISLLENSRISDVCKKNVRKQWAIAYASRNSARMQYHLML